MIHFINLSTKQKDWVSEVMSDPIKEYIENSYNEVNYDEVNYDLTEVIETLYLAKFFDIEPYEEHKSWVLKLCKSFHIDPWFK